MELKKYLRKKPIKRRIQALVPLEVIEELAPFLKKEKISWNHLINAALQNVADDLKKKKIA